MSTEYQFKNLEVTISITVRERIGYDCNQIVNESATRTFIDCDSNPVTNFIFDKAQDITGSAASQLAILWDRRNDAKRLKEQDGK